MAEWDETDLTPDEVRAMWEAATPVDQFRHTELTVTSVQVATQRTTTAKARVVDVHLTTPILALIPAYQ